MKKEISKFLMQLMIAIYLAEIHSANNYTSNQVLKCMKKKPVFLHHVGKTYLKKNWDITLYGRALSKKKKLSVKKTAQSHTH